MSFWKKAKEKWKIGVGAIGVAVLGSGAAYWAYERHGYESNVHVFNERLDHVVYGGDGGIDTPQRDAVVRSIWKYAPKKIRLLGDLCYPVGCTDWASFGPHVVTPFVTYFNGSERISREVDIILGNHSFYGVGKERAFIQRELSKEDTMLPSVRWDNYYKLKVYYNACEISWESTTADVKFGDPDIQKRQEAFVCKAVKDPRCEGKLMIGLTHQADFGMGPRGSTKSSDYKEFGERCLHDNLDYVLSGHEHLTMISGRRKRALYIIAGALAKWTPWAAAVKRPAFLTLDDGVIRIREVDTAPTMAVEED